MQDFTSIFWVLMFFLLLYAVQNHPYDSTDRVTDRSGLTLKIDNLTGCHYLAGDMFFSAVTPRLDENGKHICDGFATEEHLNDE